MAGIVNDVLYALNSDFTGGNSLLAAESNGLFTNGQIWIGRTAVNAGGTHIDVGTITGGSGITVTNGPGTITISATSTLSFTWQVIGASQALAVNNGYICTTGAALSLSLPGTSAVGDIIEISLDGSTSFTVTQGAGQSIRLGNVVSTTGVGGSIVSTARGDSIRMVCSVANLNWNILSSVGNLTIV